MVAYRKVWFVQLLIKQHGAKCVWQIAGELATQCSAFVEVNILKIIYKILPLNPVPEQSI